MSTLYAIEDDQITTDDYIIDITPTPDWTQAACAGLAYEGIEFHPSDELTAHDRRGEVNALQAICRSCPIREECLEWGLANADGYGVWGGVDFEDDHPEAGTSTTPGVFWSKRMSRWVVEFVVQGIRHYGGHHVEQEAAEDAAVKLRARVAEQANVA